MRVGDEVTAAVNLKRRADIVPNHTFTHVSTLRCARRAVCNSVFWEKSKSTPSAC